MNVLRPGFLPLVILGVSILLPACETRPPAAPAGGAGLVAPAPVGGVPAAFLATDYPALQRWLDERFEVEYRNLTPEMIFEQKPIHDIKYDISGLPADAPLFHLKSANLSRREILHQVATFWNLEMSLVKDAAGIPTVVRVVGR